MKGSGILGPLFVDTILPDSLSPSVTAVIFGSIGMAIDDTGKAAT
jgi:hypothetical protein